MIRALVLAAALSSGSTLALAQEASAPAPAPVEAQAEVSDTAEAEFQVRAEAFGGRMQAMAEEMQGAITSAGADAAKRTADLDAIEVRYQADVDDFALALEAFVSRQAAAAPEAERAAMTASIGAALPQIRSYPRQIRTQVETAAARADAAPAQPAAPN